MDYTFKIITNYYTIDEGNGYSLQLNLIKWNDNEPKYDLRRWKDDKPLKGISLTATSLKDLCKAMVSLAVRSGIDAPELKSVQDDGSSGSKKTERDLAEVPSRYQVLEILSQPEYTDRHLRIEEVIEHNATRNYLRRNGIRTLEELVAALKEENVHITPVKERIIYESLTRLKVRPKRTNTSYVREMFTEMDVQYFDLPIDSLQLFTNRRKTIDKLKEQNYKRIGDLNGILESSLECIIGADKLDLYLDIEQKLKEKPETLITAIWDRDLETRNGKITEKRTEAMSLQEIGEKAGISRERVRQMIIKFFSWQDPFLQLIDERIKASENEKVAIKQAFPETIHRRLFRVWKKQYDRRLRDDEDVETDTKMKEEQLNLFDFIE